LAQAVRTGAGGAAGSLLLLRLREANWEAHFEMEERKELTKRAKATLDDLNLQLQNLVYEEAHYNKEIQHCRDFRPREVVHDLLPAPPSGTEAKPDEDEESRAHRLMTQRLAAELEERKRHVTARHTHTHTHTTHSTQRTRTEHARTHQSRSWRVQMTGGD
jgi:septum formation inhibitor MinC